MEERMTVSNMSIEAGARAGMIAADAKTVEYLRGRRFVATGADFDRAAERWLKFRTDDGARFDKSITFDAAAFAPQVTWGTNPGMVVEVTGKVPDPASLKSRGGAAGGRARAGIHGIAAGYSDPGHPRRPRFHRTPAPTRVSATCARRPTSYADAKSPKACTRWWCRDRSRSRPKPKSSGLDRVFVDAGFEWRESGCSMCLGMNPDILKPGERCASTSNRNFEGRQGKGGRTHLVSPVMAAAAAVSGHFVDVRDWPAH